METFERNQYVLHKYRPGQIGVVLVATSYVKPDGFVLTQWEDDDRKVEVCMSRMKFLQGFDWRECLECGHQGQVQPGYWNCTDCAIKLGLSEKGWAEPLMEMTDPKEPRDSRE